MGLITLMPLMFPFTRHWLFGFGSFLSESIGFSITMIGFIYFIEGLISENNNKYYLSAFYFALGTYFRAYLDFIWTLLFFGFGLMLIIICSRYLI
jgi:hypothetical protein